MTKNILQLIIHGIFNQYKFSEVSTLGKANFDHFVSKLNPNQTTITEDENFKYIQWEDLQTYYSIRFSKNGNFLFIEEEVWHEFKFPFLRRRIYRHIRKA